MKIGVIVMWAMVSALVLCAALWPFARHADRRGRPGLLHGALDGLRRLSLPTLVALAVVLAGSVAYSGKSTNGGTGTTGILPVATVANGHVVSTGGTPVVPVVVTPQDISNGWRVAEETVAEPFAQPSANAVTNELWRRRGAHDDAFRIPADGWTYPCATGITVLSRGELRASIHAHDFPRAFDQDLSLLPHVNWPMLPEGRRESFFWHDTTPSNTLLTTWWNAALGRDTTNPVNFQAELFPSGGFTYRYEDRTVRHVRVWPFDWDDDGLENSVDPDPLVAGPDAHGTNAEWYNTVCSNVFETVGGGTGPTGILPVGGVYGVPALPWREGVNSNAYYFVDVVASSGPAPIYFTGDRDSRLGNPVVVALAGATNRVPLLIGIDYAITSSVPFTVSFPDDGFAVVTTNGVANYDIRWSLEFSVSPDGTGGFYIDVEPYDPGGAFQWGGGTSSVGLRSLPPESTSCEFSAYGNWFGFVCGTGGACGCDGCSVDGVYSLEWALFTIPSIWCGCSSHAEYPSGTNEVPLEVSVSVAFDSSVVFYENAYTNAPGEMVAKRSTRTVLTVTAYGGDAGGRLDVLTQNIGKLTCVGGTVLAFPYRAIVPPRTAVSLSAEYAAAEHSDSTDDISVAASVISLDGSSSAMASDTTTSAEILIEAEADFPTNKHRHVFGPAERVKVSSAPVLCALQASNALLANGGTVTEKDGFHEVKMSVGCGAYVFMAQCGNAELPIQLTTIFPNEKLRVDAVRRPTYDEFIDKLEVEPFTNGCIGSAMHIDLSLEPDYVSFSKLRLAEGIATARNVEGFFTNTIFQGHLDHGVTEGAWDGTSIETTIRIGSLNELVGGDLVSLALHSALRPFLDSGSFELEIPMIWFVPGGSITNSLRSNVHYNSVDQDGTVSVRKYGQTQSREITEDWPQ